MITIALSKGRIFDETLPLLNAAGIRTSEDPDKSRKLILGTNKPDVRLILVRASDVPTYVQYGGADMGVAGKDVLDEQGGQGLYQPLDLGIARCRMMVAVEEIAQISSRLIVNPASLKLKRKTMQPILDAFAKAVG